MFMRYISRSAEKFVRDSLDNRKILFLLGARQVGKTTLIEHILNTGEGEMLNMDAQIDQARFKDASELEPIEGVRALTSGKVLVIDEAQRVPHIGRITKGWYDARVPVKIILLGSSSASLASIAASELVGRNEKLWLTPLLFEEVLAGQKWFSETRTPQQLQKSFPKQVQAILMQRLIFGSYPEAFLTDDSRTYLENLTSDYLLKDIFTKSLVRSPEDVRRLLLELTREIGATVSVLQLATRLKLSRQTVQRYLDLLEGIFVIFKIPAYYTDVATEVTKSYKYYFWDTGVKNALQREWTVSTKRSDIDALWENWVVAEIMKLSRTYRRHEDLFFWRSRHGSNVELVVKQGSKLHPFNICFDSLMAKPSRAFANAYGVEPKIIYPDNILEFIL
jgi:uncharacterized protein